MQRTRRRWMAAALVASTLGAPSLAWGQQPTIGSGKWYYDMGGGAPVSPAPNINAATFAFPQSEGLRLPPACGTLDPATAIGNALGDVSGGFDDLEQVFVLAATEAIAALPALILQRANPGLYEHFQSATSQAQQLFDISVKSCERIVEDGGNGGNPFDGWVKVARRDTYEDIIIEDGEEADAIAAEEEAAEANGDGGVLWIGNEKRAGLDQEPIEVIREVVQAGFNLILGQPATSEAAPPPVEGVRLTELFASPEEAAEFAVDVLGDVIIQTCNGCSSTTTAGVGLAPKYAAERDEIQEVLEGLANEPQQVDLETLEGVSSVNVAITPQVISTLQRVDDAQTRFTLSGRLSGDVATARTVERALSLRRLLYSGRKVPEVASNALAIEQIDAALEELEIEVDTFLYEARVQKELVSETAGIVLREGERQATSAAGATDGARGNLGGVFIRGESQ